MDHFHDQVMARNKIGGHARAMVVTNGIARAIQYFHAIKAYLRERKSPHRAIVAFSGAHDFAGGSVTEASLNGFPSRAIVERIREEPYRFLVCADKFQTGYDEPLLHTMYVDKKLSSIKAVQALSRLNRSHPKKHDVFVLDFENDTDTIRDASPTTTERRSWRTRRIRTSCTICRRSSTVRRFTRRSRSRRWFDGSSAAKIATGSIRSSTHVLRSTRQTSTKAAKWLSRARPRHLLEPTTSSPACCRTPTPRGKNARSSSTS